MAPFESTGRELSFKWSHRSLSTHSEVKTTLRDSNIHSGSERVNFIVNLSSSYSLIIAFSSNLCLRLRLLRRLRLLLLLVTTTAICYVVTSLRTLLLHWIIVHATAIVMNSKDVIKSALIFYHVEFESSIASHCASPVFVEIWIIRNLQNFTNYKYNIVP